MSIYFGSTTDEELISELEMRDYIVFDKKKFALYSFDEIQYAWEESGAGFNNMDFTDFIEYLGVKRNTDENEIKEIFPDTMDSLNKLKIRNDA